MATKKIKCPARITMIKGSPPKFIINKAEHIHAELKRNKYGSSKQAQHQQHHHHQQQQQYDHHQQELNQQCYSVTAMKGDEEHDVEVDGNVKIEILTQSISSSTLQRQQHQ